MYPKVQILQYMWCLDTVNQVKIKALYMTRMEPQSLDPNATEWVNKKLKFYQPGWNVVYRHVEAWKNIMFTLHPSGRFPLQWWVKNGLWPVSCRFSVMIKMTSIAPSPIDRVRLPLRISAGAVAICVFQPNLTRLTADILACLQVPKASKRNLTLSSCCDGFCWCPGTPEPPLNSPGRSFE